MLGVNFYDVNVSVFRGDGFTALTTHRANTTVSGAIDFGVFLDFTYRDRIKARFGYEMLWVANGPVANSEFHSAILINPYGTPRDHASFPFTGPFFELTFPF